MVAVDGYNEEGKRASLSHYIWLDSALQLRDEKRGCREATTLSGLQMVLHI